MRIAILTNDYPPNLQGGAGRIAQIQAKWLCSREHQIAVWTPGLCRSNQESDVVVNCFVPRTSIPFAKLAQSSVLSRLFFHFEDLAPNLAVVEQINDWKPDVLITHNVTGCGWGTGALLQKAGIRWVHYLHDVQMFEPSGQVIVDESFHGLRLSWRRFWAKRRAKALGSPDLVISPSSWLIDAHTEFYLLKDTQRKILPNPMQIPQGYCEAKIEGENNILYVGRLSPDKGLNILLEAWKEISNDFDHLIIAGDGPLLSMVENLQDEKIVYCGKLSHDQVMIKMYENHILVMPSIVMENQPTVLLEAVAAGMHIVATDVGGVKELLNGYGQIVSPNNIKELVDCLKRIKDNKINSDLRQQILNKHNLDIVMSQLIGFFKV